MESNKKYSSTPLSFLIIGFVLGMVVGSTIVTVICDNKLSKMQTEIDNLESENALLIEENQDIMGLWSNIVIDKN